jgi:D-beta-D-heptose 7-phosphate kinase/D-beta-D-heptose 1-phosphate adenosyltransferase
MKILVIGDFILDKYNHGKINGMSPEVPTLPTFETIRTEYCFGGAANLAYNCHQHAETTLYTALGPDQTTPCTALGPDRPKLYTALGSDQPNLLPSPFKLANLGGKTATTIVERFVIDEKHVFRCERRKYEPIDIESIETEGYDIVLISDYDLGVVHSPQTLIQKTECPVIVDPFTCSDWSKYTGAYCLKPNQGEFEQMCGEVTVENVRKAIARYSLQAMIVTLGANGALWVTENDYLEVAGSSVERVADVAGAGDTFAAVFASYFDPSNIGKCLELANRAAGISVTKFGTYAVTKADLLGSGGTSQNE